MNKWLKKYPDGGHVDFISNSLGIKENRKYLKRKLLPDNIKIIDDRTIRATSGKPLKHNHRKTGDYSTDIIIDIISEAKQQGVDPSTALAIGLQETTFGKTDDNIGHIIGNHEGMSNNAVADYIKVLKNKLDLADKNKVEDEALKIQYYNGTGKLYPGTEKGYDGGGDRYDVHIPKKGLSMKKNPLFGKEIINLRDSVINQNPEILDLISSYKKGGTIKNNWLKKYK